MRTVLVNALLKSDEPSIRWKTLVKVLGEDPQSKKVSKLQQEIKRSPRVRALLAHRRSDGKLAWRRNVYDKWQGPHWVLASLADIGYPPGDAALGPVRDQVVEYWLSDDFYQEFEAKTKAQAYQRPGVPVMNGRHRRCAAQQGVALLYLTVLGLVHDRVSSLVERLLHWQWPDGGWNCDKNPTADSSSFMETLLPLRGLVAWADATGDSKARAAAKRAAEVFLTRRLFKRRSDGSVIHPEFLLLHYPLYWHYDFLAGLKAMAELGIVKDVRCADALELLAAKELPTGGWPAERRYYRLSQQFVLGADHVDWGGVSRRKMNEWVTVDALYVCAAAGLAA